MKFLNRLFGRKAAARCERCECRGCDRKDGACNCDAECCGAECCKPAAKSACCG